jgi:hypothetical protein
MAQEELPGYCVLAAELPGDIVSCLVFEDAVESASYTRHCCVGIIVANNGRSTRRVYFVTRHNHKRTFVHALGLHQLQFNIKSIQWRINTDVYCTYCLRQNVCTLLPSTLSRIYQYLILWDKFRVVNRPKNMSWCLSDAALNPRTSCNLYSVYI